VKITTKRLRKPIRKKMWMPSQDSQAGKPERRRRISSASSSLLSPGAKGAQESWPKYECVAPRQTRGRHLVEQRLEQVMVLAVEQRQLGPGARQAARGREAAEAAADDHDLCHDPFIVGGARL
jgi:hypothetical protein